MDTPFFVKWSHEVAHEQVATARNTCLTKGLGTLTKGLETLGQRHVHHLTSGVRWPRNTHARVGPDRISIWSPRRKPDGISRNRPLLEQANATSVATA